MSEIGTGLKEPKVGLSDLDKLESTEYPSIKVDRSGDKRKFDVAMETRKVDDLDVRFHWGAVGGRRILVLQNPDTKEISKLEEDIPGHNPDNDQAIIESRRSKIKLNPRSVEDFDEAIKTGKIDTYNVLTMDYDAYGRRILILQNPQDQALFKLEEVGEVPQELRDEATKETFDRFIGEGEIGEHEIEGVQDGLNGKRQLNIEDPTGGHFGLSEGKGVITNLGIAPNIPPAERANVGYIQDWVNTQLSVREAAGGFDPRFVEDLRQTILDQVADPAYKIELERQIRIRVALDETYRGVLAGDIDSFRRGFGAFNGTTNPDGSRRTRGSEGFTEIFNFPGVELTIPKFEAGDGAFFRITDPAAADRQRELFTRDLVARGLPIELARSAVRLTERMIRITGWSAVANSPIDDAGNRVSFSLRRTENSPMAYTDGTTTYQDRWNQFYLNYGFDPANPEETRGGQLPATIQASEFWNGQGDFFFKQLFYFPVIMQSYNVTANKMLRRYSNLYAQDMFSRLNKKDATGREIVFKVSELFTVDPTTGQHFVQGFQTLDINLWANNIRVADEARKLYAESEPAFLQNPLVEPQSVGEACIVGDETKIKEAVNRALQNYMKMTPGTAFTDLEGRRRAMAFLLVGLERFINSDEAREESDWRNWNEFAKNQAVISAVNRRLVDGTDAREYIIPSARIPVNQTTLEAGSYDFGDAASGAFSKFLAAIFRR